MSRILQLQTLNVERQPWKLVFSLFSFNRAVTCSPTFFKCCPREMQAYILANALVLLTLRKSVQFLHVHFKCAIFFPNLFLLLSQGPCPILCFPVESGNVVPKRPSQRNYIFLQRLVVELMLFFFFFFFFIVVEMTFWRYLSKFQPCRGHAIHGERQCYSSLPLLSVQCRSVVCKSHSTLKNLSKR